jgi:tetratricopeptide (TPR) repeat protein
LVDKNPATPDRLFLKGRCEAELGEFAGAAATLDQAVHAAPQHADWFIEWAAVLRANGDAAGASEAIREAAFVHGDDAGKADYRSRAVELLDEQTDRLARIDVLGSIERERGQAAKAVDLLTTAVAAQPNAADRHYELALALRDMKNASAALAEAEAAVQLAPSESTYRELLEELRAGR